MLSAGATRCFRKSTGSANRMIRSSIQHAVNPNRYSAEHIHGHNMAASNTNTNMNWKSDYSLSISIQQQTRQFSNMPSHLDDSNERHSHEHNKHNLHCKDAQEVKSNHCEKSTCDNYNEPEIHNVHTILYGNGTPHVCHDGYLKNELPLPPPLPEPKYSFHRRIMPNSHIQFSSVQGRKLFQESLSEGMAKAFFPLSEQFLNQSDPAYCGITTLVMVLNAIGIDPNVRWKGGWRWYGSEEMILNSCCIDAERVRRAGILLEEFQSLGRCHGLDIDMKRPHPLESTESSCEDEDAIDNEEFYSLDEFRKDVVKMVQHPPIFDDEQDIHGEEDDTNSSDGAFMVVSFSRATLGQTGDGHFSPIAAYSAETDRCLVLDVARFKYPPYWVSVKDLYESTRPRDDMTNKSRGWFLIRPLLSSEKSGSKFKGRKTVNERMRPAQIVPLLGDKKDEHGCQVGNIKVHYCAVNPNRNAARHKYKCV